MKKVLIVLVGLILILGTVSGYTCGPAEETLTPETTPEVITEEPLTEEPVVEETVVEEPVVEETIVEEVVVEEPAVEEPTTEEPVEPPIREEPEPPPKPVIETVEGFAYSADFYIEGTGSEETNYPVRLELFSVPGESSGQNIYLPDRVQADFDDLSFTLEGRVLMHWKESVAPGSSAIIWVMIDRLAPVGAPIHLDYGDPTLNDQAVSDSEFFDYME